MTIRKILSGSVAVLLVAVFLNSCKDMGDSLTALLTATPSSLSMTVGDTATVAISGGSPPYMIDVSPNPAVATASLTSTGSTTSATLIVAALGAGSTQVTIHDSGDEPSVPGDSPAGPTHGENEVTISIAVSSVPPLLASPSSVTVGSGQTVDVTITNGSPPYVIDTPPQGTLATASFVDPNLASAILQIVGVSNASATGPTSIKIKDSSPSPEREVTVPITKIP